jgi:uncharacterized protein (TIGR03083 family)
MLPAPAAIEYVDVVGGRIADAGSHDLDAVVPSCPEMTARQLVGHTATFCNWVAQLVESGQPIAPSFDPGTDVVAAMREQHAALVRALTAVEPDADCWAWGSDQHKRFWSRRAAHELGVHSWDIENAVGEPRPIDPTIAADGIDEFIDEFGPTTQFLQGAGKKFGGDGERFALDATDIGARWTFVARPAALERTTDDGADVSLAGTASDLVLFLWGRVHPGVLIASGDTTLLDRWRERVKI